jgi:hypothetical protein
MNSILAIRKAKGTDKKDDVGCVKWNDQTGMFVLHQGKIERGPVLGGRDVASPWPAEGKS